MLCVCRFGRVYYFHPSCDRELRKLCSFLTVCVVGLLWELHGDVLCCAALAVVSVKTP